MSRNIPSKLFCPFIGKKCIGAECLSYKISHYVDKYYYKPSDVIYSNEIVTLFLVAHKHISFTTCVLIKDSMLIPIVKINLMFKDKVQIERCRLSGNINYIPITRLKES